MGGAVNRWGGDRVKRNGLGRRCLPEAAAFRFSRTSGPADERTQMKNGIIGTASSDGRSSMFNFKIVR